MGFLEDALVGLTGAFVKRAKNISREAVARIYEKIAQGIREGKLVPQEAFDQYTEDAEARDDAYGKLPR